MTTVAQPEPMYVYSGISTTLSADVQHHADEHRDRVEPVAARGDEGREREQREEVEPLAHHEQARGIGRVGVAVAVQEGDERLREHDEADGRAHRADRQDDERVAERPPELGNVVRPRRDHHRERRRQHRERSAPSRSENLYPTL